MDGLDAKSLRHVVITIVERWEFIGGSVASYATGNETRRVGRPAATNLSDGDMTIKGSELTQ